MLAEIDKIKLLERLFWTVQMTKKQEELNILAIALSVPIFENGSRNLLQNTIYCAMQNSTLDELLKIVDVIIEHDLYFVIM